MNLKIQGKNTREKLKMGCFISIYLDKCNRERKSSKESSENEIVLKFSKNLSNYDYSPKYDKHFSKMLDTEKLLEEKSIKILLGELQSKIYPHSLDYLRYFMTFMASLIILTSMIFTLMYEDIIENTMPEPKDMVTLVYGTTILSYFVHLLFKVIFTLRKNVMILSKINNVKKIIHDYNLEVFNPNGFKIEISEYGNYLKIKKYTTGLILEEENEYKTTVLKDEIFKIKVVDSEGKEIIKGDSSTCDDEEEGGSGEKEEENKNEVLESMGNVSGFVPESTDRHMITDTQRDEEDN